MENNNTTIENDINCYDFFFKGAKLKLVLTEIPKYESGEYTSSKGETYTEWFSGNAIDYFKTEYNIYFEVSRLMVDEKTTPDFIWNRGKIIDAIKKSTGIAEPTFVIPYIPSCILTSQLIGYDDVILIEEDGNKCKCYRGYDRYNFVTNIAKYCFLKNVSEASLCEIKESGKNDIVEEVLKTVPHLMAWASKIIIHDCIYWNEETKKKIPAKIYTIILYVGDERWEYGDQLIMPSYFVVQRFGNHAFEKNNEH